MVKKISIKNSFIQPKLDGIRCYITKDGAFSRNHKEFKTIEHIKEAFKLLFKEEPQLILDGELYNHQFKNNFNKIISLVRKKNPTKQNKEDAERYIQFHWYDYSNFNYKDEEFSADFRTRNMFIADIMIQLKSRHIIDVQTHDVSEIGLG